MIPHISNILIAVLFPPRRTLMKTITPPTRGHDRPHLLHRHSHRHLSLTLFSCLLSLLFIAINDVSAASSSSLKLQTLNVHYWRPYRNDDTGYNYELVKQAITARTLAALIIAVIVVLFCRRPQDRMTK